MTAFFFSPALAADGCRMPGQAERVTLERVVDGDTLRVTDGRLVRLIGVNAPERAHGKRKAEPGAARATEFTQRFLGTGVIGLREGADSRDRYDRTLANVFRADGRSLEEALLREGLARAVVLPPNLALAECLMAAERSARANRAGLWGTGEFAPRTVQRLRDGENGFRLLRGRVTEVTRTRSNWWIELEDRVALQVRRADWRYFDRDAVSALQGHEVEARGWLIWRDTPANRARGRTPWMLRVGHPAGLASP